MPRRGVAFRVLFTFGTRTPQHGTRRRRGPRLLSKRYEDTTLPTLEASVQGSRSAKFDLRTLPALLCEVGHSTALDGAPAVVLGSCSLPDAPLGVSSAAAAPAAGSLTKGRTSSGVSPRRLPPKRTGVGEGRAELQLSHGGGSHPPGVRCTDARGQRLFLLELGRFGGLVGSRSLPREGAGEGAAERAARGEGREGCGVGDAGQGLQRKAGRRQRARVHPVVLVSTAVVLERRRTGTIAPALDRRPFTTTADGVWRGAGWVWRWGSRCRDGGGGGGGAAGGSGGATLVGARRSVVCSRTSQSLPLIMPVSRSSPLGQGGPGRGGQWGVTRGRAGTHASCPRELAARTCRTPSRTA